MNGGNSKQIVVSDDAFGGKQKSVRNPKKNKSRKSLRDLHIRIGGDNEFDESIKYFKSIDNVALSREPFPDENDTRVQDNKAVTSIEDKPIDSKNESRVEIIEPMDTTSLASSGPIDIKIDTPKTNEDTTIENSIPKKMDDGIDNRIHIARDPPYGILQRGKKPTFRTWKRTRSNKPYKHTEMSDTTSTVNKDKRTRTNKTIKHFVGRNDKTIRILLKNTDLRKKLDREIESIRKHKISDIRRTLKKCNIIRTGTTAPVGILREIYENSTLAGKITNKSPEILLHNFVNIK